MIRYCPEIFTEKQNKAIRIAFGQYRYLPKQLKEELQERGYMDDLRQELYLSALLAAKQSEDYKEIRRFIQRRIYYFLKEYGFRKTASTYFYRYSWGIFKRKEVENGV